MARSATKRKEAFTDILQSGALINSTKRTARPFIKWAGGKSSLLPQLLKVFPPDFDRYIEPFLGGGAVFFRLQSRNAILVDTNPELINAYSMVRDDVETLIQSLSEHRYEEKYYYEIRDLDRSAEFSLLSPIDRASRFLYLNKTCFNGLYRVNSKGQNNVPFGRYTNPKIVDPENLRACSEALQEVEIRLDTFDSIENDLTHGDFIYLDPPYLPVSATANFASYAKDGFGVKEHEKLAAFCRRIDKKKVRFALSNSATDVAIDLFKEFKVRFVEAPRAINSKAEKRGAVKELLVTNY